jgi:xanthine/uracil permease
MAILSVSGRPWMLGMLAVCGIVYVLLSFLLFRWNRQLWPIVTPAVTFCLAIVSAVLLRRTLPPFPRVAMEETRT